MENLVGALQRQQKWVSPTAAKQFFYQTKSQITKQLEKLIPALRNTSEDFHLKYEDILQVLYISVTFPFSQLATSQYHYLKNILPECLLNPRHIYKK